MESSNFYVYLHRKATDNSVFYVGKGKERRAWSKSSRNPFWHNIVKKHGYRVDVVFDGLSEDDSLQVEIDTILEMRYFGCKLANITNGGDGVSGMFHSDETKKRLSEIGMGRKPSASAVEKIVAKNTGKKRSDAIKAQFKDAQAWRRKPLYCSNGMVFNGIEDAVSWVRKNTQFVSALPSAICCAALQKKNGAAYMLRWSYKHEDLKSKSKIDCKFKGRIKCSNGMLFDNMKSSVKWLQENGFCKATFSKISAVCKGKRETAYKLKWEYVYD